MRAVLEAIVRHARRCRHDDARGDPRYTKLFWINTGPYNNLTARKFVPTFTPEALAAAVARPWPTAPPAAASRRDARDLLARLHRPFFDRDVDPW